MRRFAVLDPVKVVIENYPDDQVEQMEVVNNPEDPSAGTRPVAFSRELWIERDDFMEEPAPKFFRLAPGREVRLRNAYFVTCQAVVKDDDRAPSWSSGAPTIRPRAAATRRTGGGRRRRCTGCRRRTRSRPRSGCTTSCSRGPTRGRTGGTCSTTSTRSPRPWSRVRSLEPSLADVPVGETVQFERLGYFCVDPDSAPGAPVFNRTLTLKDTWAKVQARG